MEAGQVRDAVSATVAQRACTRGEGVRWAGGGEGEGVCVCGVCVLLQLARGTQLRQLQLASLGERHVRELLSHILHLGREIGRARDGQVLEEGDERGERAVLLVRVVLRLVGSHLVGGRGGVKGWGRGRGRVGMSALHRAS